MDGEEIIYLSEFSIVSHDPGLYLHPFMCRLKGPKRRQACGSSFKSYATICFWMLDEEDMRYLSEFSIVSYDPGLHLHLFMCRLKGQKRRQACGSSFKRYATICFWMLDEEEIIYLSEFSIVSHDPGLYLHPFRCRLKGPKRRQACGPSFKSYSTICIWRWDEEEITYLSEFSTVFHDPGLHLHPFRCRLKGPKRRQACGSSFKSYSTLCICRWDKQGIFYLGEFSIISQDAGLYLHPFRCRLKGPKRRHACRSSFTSYSTICMCRWDKQGIFYLGESPSYHRMLAFRFTCLGAVWRARRDDRPTGLHSKVIQQLVFEGEMRKEFSIMVSSSLYLMIQGFNFTHLGIVWRAQRDNRPAGLCSKAIPQSLSPSQTSKTSRLSW